MKGSSSLAVSCCRTALRTLKRAATFAAAVSMCMLMLSTLILVSKLLIEARPADPVNNEGQTLAILVCGLAVIFAYTMLFAALRVLIRKACTAITGIAPFRKIAEMMSQPHRDHENLKTLRA